MSLLALDPGYAEGCGVALFDDGKLIDADFVNAIATRYDILQRCQWMAKDVLQWTMGRGTTLIAEWPQVYVAARSKGDPNDLLGLAAVCAGVAMGSQWQRVVSVTPRDWKGTTPKPSKGAPYVMEKRVRGRLSAAEAHLLPAGVRHDIVDAVGIGLHHLGRLDRKRVIPR